MVTYSTAGQLFCAKSTGWDALRQWISSILMPNEGKVDADAAEFNTEQLLMDIIAAIGDISITVDVCVFACAVPVLCLLAKLKAAAAKLKAFSLKLLSALQGFVLRVKQCCLNIRSYAKLHFNPTGLKIALGLNIGVAVRTFPRKTGIRRHPKRMRHRARRRRRR